MILDVDFLINYFEKLSKKKNKEEFSEQDAAAGGAPSGGSTGGGGASVPKWADSYPLKRSKANMLGKAGEKWQTGLTRGAANQIW